MYIISLYLLTLVGYTDVKFIGPSQYDICVSGTGVAFTAQTTDGLRVPGVMCLDVDPVIDLNVG